MATDSIEIFDNTLLKLLVRRGTDSDRKNIVLTEGEPGYTVDTKRLFIGDGSTNGGVLVGNLFKGSNVDITTLAPAEIGDYAFDEDNNKLYRLESGTGSSINDWQEIGGVYSSGDGTIVIDGSNSITVGKLSAGDVSSDLLGDSIVLDSNNRVSLSGSININGITIRSANYLALPRQISINSVDYDWPVGGLANNYVLTTNINGDLRWDTPSNLGTLIQTGTAGQIPVGSIMPFISSNAAPTGWLLCNGQAVLSADWTDLYNVIGVTYGGDGAAETFNVPNYTNKSLYGVASDPASSTLYTITTGGPTPLSAEGVIFIIKGVNDPVVAPTLTVQNGVSATLNGVRQTSSFSHISGNVILGSEFAPVAVASFQQDETIEKSYNVVSVSLTSLAFANSEIGFPSGIVYEAINPSADTYSNGGNSGAYIIKFSNAVDINSIVDIQAYNFWQANPGNTKITDNTIPKFDYKFINNGQRLLVTIVTTTYNNSDQKATGNLKDIYLDSGQTNGGSNGTRFNVFVY